MEQQARQFPKRVNRKHSKQTAINGVNKYCANQGLNGKTRKRVASAFTKMKFGIEYTGLSAFEDTCELIQKNFKQFADFVKSYKEKNTTL